MENILFSIFLVLEKKKEIKQYYLLPLLKHLFTFHGKNINFSKVKYTTSVFSYRQSNNKT